MLYTIQWIEEDVDYGCEERSGAMPVQAIAVLLGDDGIEKTVHMPDALFYERALEAGGRVYLDTIIDVSVHMSQDLAHRG